MSIFKQFHIGRALCAVSGDKARHTSRVLCLCAYENVNMKECVGECVNVKECVSVRVCESAQQ